MPVSILKSPKAVPPITIIETYAKLRGTRNR